MGPGVRPSGAGVVVAWLAEPGPPSLSGEWPGVGTRPVLLPGLAFALGDAGNLVALLGAGRPAQVMGAAGEPGSHGCSGVGRRTSHHPVFRQPLG